MSSRKWTTQYPANLDGDAQQPALENRVHDIDETHANVLSTAVRALQFFVGSDNLEAGSLREQLGSIPSTTLANLNNKITDATLIDTGDSRLSDARSANALLSRVIATTAPSDGETYLWNSTSSEWEPGIPVASGIPSVTLAELNLKVTDATLIDTGDSRLSDSRAPTSHTHVKSEVTDFSHDHVKADVTDFAHDHVKADVTDFAHTHTKSEVTDFTHDHTASDVTDFDTEVGNHSDVAANTTHRGLTNNPHSVSASGVGNSIAQWNADKLQGRDVSAAVPSSGQVLKFDGATISWGTDESGGGGVTDFVSLTDTPSNLTGHAHKGVRVNLAESALEFVVPSGTAGVSNFLGLDDAPSTYSGQNGKVAAVNGGENALEFISLPSVISTLLGLTDTPANYSGAANYFVKVKTDQTGIEFVVPSGTAGVANLTELDDTPANYTGSAHKIARVNIAENALEFVAPSGVAGASDFTDLGDTPGSYSGDVHKMVRVNSAGDGLEFVAPSGTAGTTEFTGLTDTPANFDNAADYFVKVKQDQTGLEFIAPSGINFDEALIDLTDTPSNYSGDAHKMLRVNLAENAVEFVAPSGAAGAATFTSLTDTPGSYSGHSGKLLTVNVAEDAVEFSGIRRILEDVFTADSPDGSNRQTFTLTVTTAANADTPSGRDVRGVFRNGNRQKHIAATPGSREYTMAANNQVTVGGLTTDDDIEIIYGG